MWSSSIINEVPQLQYVTLKNSKFLFDLWYMYLMGKVYGDDYVETFQFINELMAGPSSRAV